VQSRQLAVITYIHKTFKMHSFLRSRFNNLAFFVLRRTIMATAVQDTKALVVVSQDQMLERLQNSEAMLDDINRGLNDYLEKKRLFFPRYVNCRV